MKKIIIVFAILLLPVFASAQTKQYFLYNIITFDGNFKKEGLKVNIDDGKSVEKLRDSNGNRVVFKTPAAALMYFISQGWELYVNGGTTEGETVGGIGESKTTSYWILRKPCSKEEFEKIVEEGIRK